MQANRRVSNSRQYFFLCVGLTEDLIISQAVIFFLSGYDTTATMLAFLAYNLALNPDCQERLHREIDDIVKASVSTAPGLQRRHCNCRLLDYSIVIAIVGSRTSAFPLKLGLTGNFVTDEYDTCNRFMSLSFLLRVTYFSVVYYVLICRCCSSNFFNVYAFLWRPSR